MKRVQKLLDNPDFTSVTVHGLGAAIQRAVNVALSITTQSMGSVDCAATTESIHVRLLID